MIDAGMNTGSLTDDIRRLTKERDDAKASGTRLSEHYAEQLAAMTRDMIIQREHFRKALMVARRMRCRSDRLTEDKRELMKALGRIKLHNVEGGRERADANDMKMIARNSLDRIKAREGKGE